MRGLIASFGLFLALPLAAQAAPKQLEAKYRYECARYEGSAPMKSGVQPVLEKQQDVYILEVGENTSSFLGIGFGGPWISVTNETSGNWVRFGIEKCLNGYTERGWVRGDDRCTNFHQEDIFGYFSGGGTPSDNPRFELPQWYNANLGFSLGFVEGTQEGLMSNLYGFGLEGSNPTVYKVEFRCQRTH